MRVLVLGGTGMIGHALAAGLARRFDVVATMRGPAADRPAALAAVRVAGGVDAADEAGLARLLDGERPDAVLNAVGLVKQRLDTGDVERAVALNALLPHRLARLCRERGIRLVQYGTDCVFAGAVGDVRGPHGYREEDPPGPVDVYGRSKLLGEPSGTGCLVLRTSVVGRELGPGRGLVEWFLAQGAGPVRGYERALFSGLSTPVLARLTGDLLARHPGLDGVWHVAAEPIAKLDLLRLLRTAFGRPTAIQPDHAFHCDRRLDGARFRAATGWRAPPWPEMVAELAGALAGRQAG